MKTIGVDVSKKELVVCMNGRIIKLYNTRRSVRAFLKKQEPETRIGMEATGTYFYLLANMACETGFEVYVINPKDIKRYKDAVASRTKTDRTDAECIARFVEKEHDELRVYKPVPKQILRLQSLVRRRGKVVSARQKIELSLRDLKELKRETDSLMRRIDALLKKIDALREEILKDCEAHGLLQGIPGIGPLISAGLLSALLRGDFHSADAFVSFLGLDLRARDSGETRGRRRLTKQGDPELRRLLFNGAMRACRTKAWENIYRRMQKRGMERIPALVAISRKLARTAWSMYRHHTLFSAERLCQPLTT